VSQSGKQKKWRANGRKKKAKRGAARRERRIQPVKELKSEDGMTDHRAPYIKACEERDQLQEQLKNAMDACTWATHKTNHTEPKHCIAALSSLFSTSSGGNCCEPMRKAIEVFQKHGCEASVKRPDKRICGECSGSGEIGLSDGEVPCPRCWGSGDPDKPGVFKPKDRVEHCGNIAYCHYPTCICLCAKCADAKAKDH
jgi:hypothetical protein